MSVEIHEMIFICLRRRETSKGHSRAKAQPLETINFQREKKKLSCRMSLTQMAYNIAERKKC